MTAIKIIWCVFGYIACGVGWYLFTGYLAAKDVIDQWSMFYPEDGVCAVVHILVWPMVIIGFSLSVLFQKIDELHEKIYFDLIQKEDERNKGKRSR